MFATIVIFILILTFVILMHEFGHFLLAKKNGVTVKEFGIGIPPLACKFFTWDGTDFTLNWLPLGGFCAMEGEETVEEIPTAKTAPTKTEKEIDKSGYFNYKKTWQKFSIIIAGPLMNFLLGALAFVILFGFQGIPVAQPGRIFLESVESGSPAQEAGLLEQTQILSIESSQSGVVTVSNVDDFVAFINDHRGQLVSLTTTGLCDQAGKCQAETLQTQVYLRSLAETPAGSGALGISLSSYRNVYYPWYKHIPVSVYYGFRESFLAAKELILGLVQALRNLFSRQPNNLVVMGPVGIVSQLNRYQTFGGGWLAILQFVGILSINLGIMNLLPIPALDGGRIILIFLEKCCGRRKIAKFSNALNYFGFICIILLSIVVTGRDIIRVIQGN